MTNLSTDQSGLTLQEALQQAGVSLPPNVLASILVPNGINSAMPQPLNNLSSTPTTPSNPSVGMNFSDLLRQLPQLQAMGGQMGLSGVMAAHMPQTQSQNPQTAPTGQTGPVTAPTVTPDKQAMENLIASEGAKMFGQDQVPALLRIVEKESGFNPTAQNPHSTAYGLFQFLDGTWQGTGIPKTADPVAQTQAGLDYIKNRYGTPNQALTFHNEKGWY